MWIRPAGPVPFLFPTLTNGGSNDHVSLSECQATMSSNNNKDGGVVISLSSSPLKFGDTTSSWPAHQIVPNGSTTLFYASPTTTSLSYDDDDDDELLHSLSNNNNTTAPHNITMLSNNCAASSFEPYSGSSGSGSRKQGRGNMVNFGESGKPIKPRATYLEEEYV